MKKYNVTVNGNTYEVCVEELGTQYNTPVAPQPVASPAPTISTAAPQQPVQTTASNSGDGIKITAPMPGTILDVKVSVGASVKKGDVVCVLEAMKMENDIPASADGIVASIEVQNGSSVSSGAVLITLK